MQYKVLNEMLYVKSYIMPNLKSKTNLASFLSAISNLFRFHAEDLINIKHTFDS